MHNNSGDELAVKWGHSAMSMVPTDDQLCFECMRIEASWAEPEAVMSSVSLTNLFLTKGHKEPDNWSGHGRMELWVSTLYFHARGIPVMRMRIVVNVAHKLSCYSIHVSSGLQLHRPQISIHSISTADRGIMEGKHKALFRICIPSVSACRKPTNWSFIAEDVSIRCQRMTMLADKFSGN